MKRVIIFCVIFAVMILTGVAAQTTQAAAELSFSFTRQNGPASNQFAVWVEDADGKYIETLYATKYTAGGGWKRRETSIPVWVKQSNLSGMTKAQVDALTGATPKNGTVTYTWDGTDGKGAALPAGNYVICLEGTLRRDNQVYYRAPIQLGQGPGTAEVKVEYVGTPPANERSMIGNVKVRTLR